MAFCRLSVALPSRDGRRYGHSPLRLHGLSFEFIAIRLTTTSPILTGKRAVAAHLGNGASLGAMRDGESVDMVGLTPRRIG